MKEGFLDISGDALLVGAKVESNRYQIVEKWWTGQKAVVEAQLAGRCTTSTVVHDPNR